MTLLDVHHGHTYYGDVYTWIASGGLKVTVGFSIYELTAVMLIVVTTVSTLVHVYSVGYMHGENGYWRFYSYLNLFTFSMLMLIMANNFIQLYFGWEAVGLCSYLLIGFYYDKESAAIAGKKAFIVNRFGDFGFAIGIFLIYLNFGSLDYRTVFSALSDWQTPAVSILGIEADLITVIALLLFCGAVGKSAQLPLHVWLPDAMEGPTPVSALIHAATMVTAGVFLLARCSPIFNLSPAAMGVVAVVGAVTALFAATIALVQNDIKRVIAYSTISQLGYMVLACGVGAYSAGIFHLYTHAFFKALLFLGAGPVIHAVHDQDIRNMGGLFGHMKITAITFWVASLSISGFPLLAGFFSKDEILWLAWASGGVFGKSVWAVGALTALLTAFYSFRLIFLTFHGEFRGGPEKAHHLHESPLSMTVPLMLLCAGAVAAGWVGLPALWGFENQFAHFLNPVVGHPEVHGSHAEEWFIMGLSIIIGLAGIGIAWFLYGKKSDIPGRLASVMGGVPYRWLLNKYYVDELYDRVFVRPTVWVARNVLVAVTDGAIIEGIVNGVPAMIGRLSGQLRRLQTGVLHHYALIMVFGAFALLAVALVWTGGN
jgi:NADH-quinone oxidoreductase subunit L